MGAVFGLAALVFFFLTIDAKNNGSGRYLIYASAYLVTGVLALMRCGGQ